MFLFLYQSLSGSSVQGSVDWLSACLIVSDQYIYGCLSVCGPRGCRGGGHPGAEDGEPVYSPASAADVPLLSTVPSPAADVLCAVLLGVHHTTVNSCRQTQTGSEQQ